jgi:hypothetical protein
MLSLYSVVARTKSLRNLTSSGSSFKFCACEECRVKKQNYKYQGFHRIYVYPGKVLPHVEQCQCAFVSDERLQPQIIRTSPTQHGAKKISRTVIMIPVPRCGYSTILNMKPSH